MTTDRQPTPNQDRSRNHGPPPCPPFPRGTKGGQKETASYFANSAKPADYASDHDIRWCPGCGNFSILAQLKNVLAATGIPREKIAIVSGIGCSSRLPYYLDTYGIHGIHGRAPAIATGLKSCRPDLHVWVITGDGDALSIGGNHLIHCLRRNVDVNILLFNNRTYGLTKGQFSPTTPWGQITNSSPLGTIDYPLHAISLAIGCEATFVARTIDTHPHHLARVLRRAAEHPGTSFVEVYQNCRVFNDGAWSFASRQQLKSDTLIELEHGKPLVFGQDRGRGIRLRGAQLEIVSLDRGTSESELLVHDERTSEPGLAFLLSRMQYPNFPEPIGVFRAVERPRFEELLQEQIQTARRRKGPGDLQQLFHSGDTWTVP